MCFSLATTVALATAGGAATLVTARRGDPAAIWGTLGYFTGMEVLQLAGYGVLDQCGTPENRVVTQLSYLHIALQPLVINLFCMAIAPGPVARTTRRWVLGLSALASLVLLARLLPLPALGDCAPGTVLCGEAWCTRSGEWHIAWEVPLNGLTNVLGLPGQFHFYLGAVFLLPLLYGAWRFVVFHLAFGPMLAWATTSDPNEMPAVWCLFSVGLILTGLSPVFRHRVMGARRAAA